MATNVERLAEGLQDVELKILKVLKDGASLTVEQIAAKSSTNIDSVRRALFWLQNKNLINVESKSVWTFELTNLGKNYATKGLPERRFLQQLNLGPKCADDLAQELGLNKQEIKYSIGYWKAKGAIEFKGHAIQLTNTGKAYLSKKTLEEEFLQKVLAGNVSLGPEDKEALEILQKRGLAKKILHKEQKYQITSLGSSVLALAKEGPKIGKLTPDLIKSKAWETAQFRRYDVLAQVPKIWPGKTQPYLAFLNEVRRELIALGFEEVTGPIIELALWNCDALFMPQDHPARGIHDIYYIKEPKYANIKSANIKSLQNLIKAVKRVHENGGFSGSKGWQYVFDEKQSMRLLLRSQGTALSARTLAQKPKIPGAYFSIARCFRPDVVDATHLPEFNQCEGLVLGEYNLRHLIGLLTEFAQKITGTDKIRLRPSYFPFTEPSLEADIWYDGKWVEALGAGLLRPEVLEPFGIKVPVLAWGIGIDRLFMIKTNIKDIRVLFSKDIQWLREFYFTEEKEA
ncbi:MAG: phenylalanine--tRNA ligase subunit alpha [Candidatus Nanoarchaeia archaeon]